MDAQALDALLAEHAATAAVQAEAEAAAGEEDLLAGAPPGGNYVTFDDEGNEVDDPTSEALFTALREGDVEEAYELAQARDASPEHGDNTMAFQAAMEQWIKENPEQVAQFEAERPGGGSFANVRGIDLDDLDLDADDREFGDLDDDESDGEGGALEGADGAVPARPVRPPRAVVCARCYSLTHRNQLRGEGADESQMPGFAFTRVLGGKFRTAYEFRRLVALLVVDAVDFDGSFPTEAADLLAAVAREREAKVRYDSGGENTQSGASRRAPPISICVAANKADLLPTQATRMRLSNWVRERCVELGLPRPTSVHMVSAKTDVGVRDLLGDLEKKVGERGDVWILGAQNAGKSSLINSLRRQRAKIDGPGSEAAMAAPVTEAHVPGTTIGVVRLPGVLKSGRLYDTPGLEHSHSLSLRLGPDAVKALMPNGRLRPRTWRMAAGQTLLLGGVVRVEVVESAASGGGAVYLTAWLSGEVPCHMSKTERAIEIFEKDRGSELWPPLTPEAAEELGELVPTDVVVEGDNWMHPQTDVSVAGLGWVAVGIKGRATLRVWAPQGAAVTTRSPALVADTAERWERPGRSVLIKKGTKASKKGRAGSGKRHKKRA